jgi:hypothetical protein
MKKTYLQHWGRDRTKRVKASNSSKARGRRERVIVRLEEQLAAGTKRVKDIMVSLGQKDKDRILLEKEILETKLKIT